MTIEIELNMKQTADGMESKCQGEAFVGRDRKTKIENNCGA
jgi:hypothetical protein